jgi:hypothetical protein
MKDGDNVDEAVRIHAGGFLAVSESSLKLSAHAGRTELMATKPIENLQRIAKDIRMWLIDRPIPWARNPRTHSDAQVAQIAASIAKFDAPSVLAFREQPRQIRPS